MNKVPKDSLGLPHIKSSSSMSSELIIYEFASDEKLRLKFIQKKNENETFGVWRIV